MSVWHRNRALPQGKGKKKQWNEIALWKFVVNHFLWNISIPLKVTENLLYILLLKHGLLFSLHLLWESTWSINKRWDCICGTAVQFVKVNYIQRRKKHPNSLTIISARLCSRISWTETWGQFLPKIESVQNKNFLWKFSPWKSSFLFEAVLKMY